MNDYVKLISKLDYIEPMANDKEKNTGEELTSETMCEGI